MTASRRICPVCGRHQAFSVDGLLCITDETPLTGFMSHLHYTSAEMRALDDENHARDLDAEHYDLSWRDRDD